MSGSQFDAHDLSRIYRTQLEKGATDSAAPADRELLERILDHAFSLDPEHEPLDSVQGEAFREVAARHRGEPLTLEPVTIDLVGAVLRVQWGIPQNDSDFWKAVTQRIAQSLFEDPPAHARLETFWARLCGDLP